VVGYSVNMRLWSRPRSSSSGCAGDAGSPPLRAAAHLHLPDPCSTTIRRFDTRRFPAFWRGVNSPPRFAARRLQRRPDVRRVTETRDTRRINHTRLVVHFLSCVEPGRPGDATIRTERRWCPRPGFLRTRVTTTWVLSVCRFFFPSRTASVPHRACGRPLGAIEEKLRSPPGSVRRSVRDAEDARQEWFEPAVTPADVTVVEPNRNPRTCAGRTSGSRSTAAAVGRPGERRLATAPALRCDRPDCLGGCERRGRPSPPPRAGGGSDRVRPSTDGRLTATEQAIGLAHPRTLQNLAICKQVYSVSAPARYRVKRHLRRSRFRFDAAGVFRGPTGREGRIRTDQWYIVRGDDVNVHPPARRTDEMRHGEDVA